jgi:hypothetical protein
MLRPKSPAGVAFQVYLKSAGLFDFLNQIAFSKYKEPNFRSAFCLSNPK